MSKEFVMVPRYPTREMLNGVCMHPDLARSLWHGLLKNAPQHQGEPVCEVVDMKYNRVQFYRATGDLSKQYLAPGTKLYTHADPGEVERLRSELSTITKLYGEACQASYDFGSLRAQLNSALDLSGERFDEVQKLRAKLAEAHALLREADEFMYIMTAHDGHAKLAHRYGKDWWDAIDKLRGKVCTALSASAEPSAPKCETCSGHGAVGNILNAEPCPDCSYGAPVEIDHLTPDEINQMAFEEGQPAENGDGYAFTQEEFDLFVTRLLDRHGTPVEIDERAEFEEWWSSEMNTEVMDLHRHIYPMERGWSYACVETNRAWMTWQARAALERNP